MSKFVKTTVKMALEEELFRFLVLHKKESGVKLNKCFIVSIKSSDTNTFIRDLRSMKHII